TYPKDRRGKPAQPVKFTIRAEKCPNRRGVEKVLEHFQGKVIPFDDVIRQAGEGKVRVVYLAGSYPPVNRFGKESAPQTWISTAQAEALKKVQTVILQALLPTAVSEFAHYIIPGGVWAEKEGTYVNHAGLAQALRWAVTPTGECRTDGQVFLDLLERK